MEFIVVLTLALFVPKSLDLSGCVWSLCKASICLKWIVWGLCADRHCEENTEEDALISEFTRRLQHGPEVLCSVWGLDVFTFAASGVCPTDCTDNTCLSPCPVFGCVLGCLGSFDHTKHDFWHCKCINSSSPDSWITQAVTESGWTDGHACWAWRIDETKRQCLFMTVLCSQFYPHELS